MYQTNSIIRTCKNLNLTFPFFEFRPRVQNPVPTFKPASHPIITRLFAIVIGNPPRPCSFSPALFLPLSFFYQQATNKMPSGRKRNLSSVSRRASSSSTGSRPLLSQEAEPRQPFVCRLCHFSALDASGLLQHLSVSPHCSMSASLFPPTPHESVDSSPPLDVNNDDLYDYPTITMTWQMKIHYCVKEWTTDSIVMLKMKFPMGYLVPVLLVS